MAVHAATAALRCPRRHLPAAAAATRCPPRTLRRVRTSSLRHTPGMSSWLYCCQGALKDALKGISCLTALGGLACLLCGVRAMLPLGATVADPSVAWFAWVLW